LPIGGETLIDPVTRVQNRTRTIPLGCDRTFEGTTEPDAAIDIDFSGNEAVDDWREVQRRGVKWAYAPVEEVQEIIASSGYSMEKVKLVKGVVEEIIPATVPAPIALLRLDTDWYSSTRHEMEHLYPKLSLQLR